MLRVTITRDTKNFLQPEIEIGSRAQRSQLHHGGRIAIHSIKRPGIILSRLKDELAILKRKRPKKETKRREKVPLFIWSLLKWSPELFSGRRPPHVIYIRRPLMTQFPAVARAPIKRQFSTSARPRRRLEEPQ